MKGYVAFVSPSGKVIYFTKTPGVVREVAGMLIDDIPDQGDPMAEKVAEARRAVLRRVELGEADLDD